MTPRLAPLARGTIGPAALAAVLLFTVGSSTVLACPVCFGAEESGMIDATKLGIFVLLVITLAVQAAFVAFFLSLRKHARRAADEELETEWSELQRGAPRTS